MRRSIPPIPTLGEMVQICAANRDLAQRQALHFRELIEREPPGPKLDELRAHLSRHAADFEHWADYTGYYRARCAQEGENTVPRVIVPGGANLALVVRQAPPAAPDRRLPREPGEDDGEELPF